LTPASGATALGSACRALQLTLASGATAHGSPQNPTPTLNRPTTKKNGCLAALSVLN
jgi:hypothetical protein